MGKMIVLTFSDSEETVFKRAVSLLADELQIEVEQQPVSPSVLSFQGLESGIVCHGEQLPQRGMPDCSANPSANVCASMSVYF